MSSELGIFHTWKSLPSSWILKRKEIVDNQREVQRQSQQQRKQKKKRRRQLRLAVLSETNGPEDRSQLLLTKDLQEGGPVSKEEVGLVDYKLNYPLQAVNEIEYL